MKVKKRTTDVNGFKVSKDDMAHMFGVYTNENTHYYNLMKTFTIDNVDKISPLFYESYTWVDGDQWSLLSHKFYGTIELYYMILKFNNIVDPFEEIQPGTIIKIPTTTAIQSVISGLKKK